MSLHPYHSYDFSVNNALYGSVCLVVFPSFMFGSCCYLGNSS